MTDNKDLEFAKKLRDVVTEHMQYYSAIDKNVDEGFSIIIATINGIWASCVGGYGSSSKLSKKSFSKLVSGLTERLAELTEDLWSKLSQFFNENAEEEKKEEKKDKFNPRFNFN